MNISLQRDSGSGFFQSAIPHPPFGRARPLTELQTVVKKHKKCLGTSDSSKRKCKNKWKNPTEHFRRMYCLPTTHDLSHCGMRFGAVRTRKGHIHRTPCHSGSHTASLIYQSDPSTPSTALSRSLHCGWVLPLTAAPRGCWAWLHKLSFRLKIIVTPNHIRLPKLCLTSHVKASLP